MTKRDIFSELMTGMLKVKKFQVGKISLKTYGVSKLPRIIIAPQKLRAEHNTKDRAP